MKDKQVNVAIQVLPFANPSETYSIVDKAIAVIEQSGLKYRVTPFETVIEGKYSEVMEVVLKAQEACYDGRAESVLCNLKIQSHSQKEVTIEDKTGKYDNKKGC
ncbi:thiamine-binding protein [Carboxylicivirga linearis]|uniref:Thiamine-binding protein n=1 Tax=Carboxylicivirga linearis TaxID=1628157 RepID=A0ABS5JZY1_9BACT|nr:thiamine-binding protein [Carboxylicivirga linearis]MBS2100044.1 thiamine-binding protein [Carboxylicivirga linearis]